MKKSPGCPERQGFLAKIKHYGIVLCKTGFIFLILTGCNVCDIGGPSGGSEKGEIYFTSLPMNSDIPGIFAISADGSGLREIVRNGIIYSSPSANGRIAYLRNSIDGNDEIRMVDIFGQNDAVIVTSKTAGTVISYPSISPDGKYVAFIGLVGEGRELNLATDNGSSVFHITSNMTSGTFPAFSPDGRQLAFFEGDRMTGGLKLKVVSTRDVLDVRVSLPLGENSRQWLDELTIDWSADGTSLLYSATTDTSGKMYELRLDSPNNAKVFNMDVLGVFMPAFSPADMNMAAFISRKGEVYTRVLDEGNPQFRKLTESDTNIVNKYIQWSPDGRYLIYSRFYNNENVNPDLMIVDVNTGETGTMLLTGNIILKGFWKRKQI